MRVLIYARVSKEEQYPENQIQQLREYCKIRGWIIYDVLWDKASGWKDREKRKNFDLVFKLASQRKYDLLLVWALDRFTREGVYKTMNYIKRLNDNGVAFKSYQEEFLDTSGIWKDVIIAIFATMAELESKRRSERIKAGLKRSGRTGGREQISLAKQKRIKELRAEGMSIRNVAKKLGINRNSVIKYSRTEKKA
mgnify:CR=1 FL=1